MHMNTGDPDRFKIRLDNNDPEPLRFEGQEESRLDKLNQRVTLVAVFIPCLLLLMMAAGYIEFKKHLAENTSSSMAALSDLYKEMETRIKELSETMASVEGRLSAGLEKLAQTEKELARLKSGYAVIEKNTVDKKDQEKALDEINARITAQVKPIADQIKPVSDNIAALQGRLASGDQKLADITEKMTARLRQAATASKQQDKTIREMQNRLAQLDRIKADNNTLKSSLRSEINQLNEKNSQLERELSKLRFELVKIHSQLGTSDGSGIIEQTIK